MAPILTWKTRSRMLSRGRRCCIHTWDNRMCVDTLQMESVIRERNIPHFIHSTYPTTSSSFDEGSIDLYDLAENITNSLTGCTYADRINLMTHSKDSLVARRYLVGRFSPSVGRLIMAEPPNLGALKAAWETIIPGVNLGNLYPLWPWVRNKAGQQFGRTPNPELLDLNRDTLPSGVAYTIIYSQKFKTDVTFTLQPLTVGWTWGDGIVPWFSQLGLQFDPNKPLAKPVLIHAFDGIAIAHKEIDAPHPDISKRRR